jgi:hypothetical protein
MRNSANVNEAEYQRDCQYEKRCRQEKIDAALENGAVVFESEYGVLRFVCEWDDDALQPDVLKKKGEFVITDSEHKIVAKMTNGDIEYPQFWWGTIAGYYVVTLDSEGLGNSYRLSPTKE